MNVMGAMDLFSQFQSQLNARDGPIPDREYGTTAMMIRGIAFRSE
jgi:hypothetical protein